MTQACSQLEFYLQDVVAALRTRLAQAEEAALAGDAKAEGKREAYADVLTILAQHADAFGLSPAQVGLTEDEVR